MNPLDDPMIVYLRAFVGARIHRLRNEPDRSRGASAIEWAIITAVLALIAVTIGKIIMDKIKAKADSINTGT
ncbi:Flp family type IVb pilin [Actinomadura atramentaria]|uniref:Flp family type IVb pilin n=1 Tax=Actinomadura atramentaria TaxID=1990 RepID=UPI000368E6EC|nr:hypothetical protein [Actinomadura atramentaria]